jgi:ribosomal protein L37E
MHGERIGRRNVGGRTNMKICPKCGYFETEYWRQNRWRTNVEFTKVSEFQVDHPTLYNHLMLGHETATDRFYAYQWGNKSHTIVERVLLSEFVVSGSQAFHIPREKVDHTKDPSQTTFSEAQ